MKEINRLNDKEVQIRISDERIMSNQELYDQFAHIKVIEKQLESQLQNAKDTVIKTEENLKNIRKDILFLNEAAREAESFLEREKQIREAGENGI